MGLKVTKTRSYPRIHQKLEQFLAHSPRTSSGLIYGECAIKVQSRNLGCHRIIITRVHNISSPFPTGITLVTIIRYKYSHVNRK